MKLDYNFLLMPVGLILLATEHNQLCWLSIGDEKTVLLQELQQQPHYLNAKLQRNHALNLEMAESLVLAPRGTAWQQQVWQALQQIPKGTTISYTELAQRCAKPKAARAVASACAKNPISLFIPCHRVIAKSGKLGGYRWGVERKKWLLNWEKSEC